MLISGSRKINWKRLISESSCLCSGISSNTNVSLKVFRIVSMASFWSQNDCFTPLIFQTDFQVFMLEMFRYMQSAVAQSTSLGIKRLLVQYSPPVGHCAVSLRMTLYPLLSIGSTYELRKFSWLNWIIVDWCFKQWEKKHLSTTKYDSHQMTILNTDIPTLMLFWSSLYALTTALPASLK